MAKTKDQEVSPDAQTANAAGEERRQRENVARLANAQKQRTYRENMKAKGYKAVKLWEKPPEPGMAAAWKGPPPLIHEETAGICERDEKTNKAIDAMFSAFFESMRGDENNLSSVEWTTYKDIEVLLAPLGYKSRL